MAPRAATSPRKPRETPTARGGRGGRFYKSKPKERRRRYKLNLKGWLKTPADWARFNAWAKINAQPKKIPEPEPIVRQSRPLSKLRRGILCLTQHPKRTDPSVHCNADFRVRRAALRFVANKRTIRLAWPTVRKLLGHLEGCREFWKVAPGALEYMPSDRIRELSKPKIFIPEECRPKTLKIPKCALRHMPVRRVPLMSLTKKLILCPDQMTPEEMAELFTPRGVRRSALRYKLTSWMVLLSVPAYKQLKGRKDSDARTWMKMILEEGDARGKQALEEQLKRRAQARRAKKKKLEAKKKRGKKQKSDQAIEESKEKEEEEEEETKKEEEEPVDEEEAAKAEKRAEERKIEKNAWRYAPPPVKDRPFHVKRAALTGEASSRTSDLAQPRMRKVLTVKSNPFNVKKAALSASASGRTEDLAKPRRPLSPIERPPPREKDEYGRPIFEPPVYGKELPKTKPYKMGDCPTEEKEKVVKKRPIDPIAYEATIDPCIFPRLAKKQQRERKRINKLSKKRGNRRKRQKKRRNTP